MAVKEVGTGVLAVGGVGGTGYGVYYVMQPHTLGDQLIDEWIKEGSKEEGRPFTAASDWWSKGFDRYVLETEESGFSGDKFDSLSGSTDGDRLNSFKQQCIDLLKSSLSNEQLESKKQKAKRWCVTYKTVGDELKGKALSQVSETNKTNWANKYTTATSTSAPHATKIKKIHTENSNTDSTIQQANAVYKWCEMALNMSASKKNQVDGDNGYCILQTVSNG